MHCGTYQITDHEHGHVACLGGLVDLFRLTLHHVLIGHHHLLPIQGLELGLVDTKDGGHISNKHLRT